MWLCSFIVILMYTILLNKLRFDPISFLLEVVVRVDNTGAHVVRDGKKLGNPYLRSSI